MELLSLLAILLSQGSLLAPSTLLGLFNQLLKAPSWMKYPHVAIVCCPACVQMEICVYISPIWGCGQSFTVAHSPCPHQSRRKQGSLWFVLQKHAHERNWLVDHRTFLSCPWLLGEAPALRICVKPLVGFRKQWEMPALGSMGSASRWKTLGGKLHLYWTCKDLSYSPNNTCEHLFL
jgi:hypothetical protein